MAYFRNFPIINYQFGDSKDLTAMQDLTAYIDIIDRVRDDAAFYEMYTILPKERPDWLSFKLYGDNRFHWTFYLLNDKIRRQGWPLDYNEVVQKAKEDYPNDTFTFNELMHDQFLAGTTFEGLTSGATGKILRRNLDLGQITYEKTSVASFTAATELVVQRDASGAITNSGTGSSFTKEYLAAHHYENADKETVDIDPLIGAGVLLTEITYLGRYEKANDELREIKVLRPNVINDIDQAFQEALTGTDG